MSKKILIVDDDALCRAWLEQTLTMGGYEVISTSSPFSVGRLLASEQPDLVLMDVEMPTLSGDSLIEISTRRKLHQCPMVFHSSLPASRLAELVTTSGAAGFVEKTSDAALLLRKVRSFA